MKKKRCDKYIRDWRDKLLRCKLKKGHLGRHHWHGWFNDPIWKWNDSECKNPGELV